MEASGRKPRLRWFSPLPPARTGIADYTAQILPYLVEYADVSLWTDQAQYDKSLERYAPVHRYQPGSLDWTCFLERTGGESIPVYHIGNNGECHQAIWETSQKLPGITVLHDTRLQHFFAYVTRSRNRAFYLDAMEKHYGENGLRWGARFLGGGTSAEEMSAQFPLVRLAAHDSLATIVHSAESLELLKTEGYAGAAYLPFPYKSREAPPSRSTKPPFRIVICGYLGPNRRIDSFLRALGAFPQKGLFRVEIYGPIWDPTYIQRILQEEGLVSSVQLFGYKPMADLNAALVGAHLAINLRYPTMGEASMSQLQLWDHGIASMVTPIGWYSQLPEGTVLFVRPNREVEDIQTHLREFLKEPERFFAMGDVARQTLRAQHDPAKYAMTLARHTGNVAGHARKRAAFELADRVVSELSRWGVASSNRELADKVSLEISALLGPNEAAG